MVKIQTRVSRRHYLKTKRTYEYDRMSLHIPKKYHETVKPFLDQDFAVRLTEENGSLTIVLTPNRNATATSKKPTEKVTFGLSASANV